MPFTVTVVPTGPLVGVRVTTCAMVGVAGTATISTGKIMTKTSTVNNLAYFILKPTPYPSLEDESILFSGIDPLHNFPLMLSIFFWHHA